MHPDRRFHWADEREMFAFVDQVGFAHLFVQGPDGPIVAHTPLIVTEAGKLRFHLARANRMTAHLDGARVAASIAGPDAYISPDWYGSENQVPTWNYVTVEAIGTVRQLDQTELVDIVDRLSAAHEERLAPKPAWTRDKLNPERFAGLLKAIIGFEMEVEQLIGTRKLGQNKSEAEISGAVQELEAIGHSALAGLMRAARG
jgi:transcriptional regulator